MLIFKSVCFCCRRVVALASNILPHAANEKYTWRDSQWSRPLAEGDMCMLTYFLEPLAWMSGVAVGVEGRLQCPQCQSKLGSFSWTMGVLKQFFYLFMP